MMCIYARDFIKQPRIRVQINSLGETLTSVVNRSRLQLSVRKK